MFFISLAPYFLNISTYLYLITTIISGLIFLYYAVNLFTDTEQNQVAKKLFWYSILYLFIIFCLFVLTFFSLIVINDITTAIKGIHNSNIINSYFK